MLGFEENEETRAAERGTLPPNKKAYDEVEFIGLESPTKYVTRPYAYVIPAEMTKVRDNLDRHGVQMEVLREDLQVELEEYEIVSVDIAEKPFQKHRLAEVTVNASTSSRKCAAGSVIVKTDQDLGRLATLLLEPESQDGLVTWNFFDDYLEKGKAFPVMRLPKRIAMRTTGYSRLKPDRMLQKLSLIHI